MPRFLPVVTIILALSVAACSQGAPGPSLGVGAPAALPTPTTVPLTGEAKKEITLVKSVRPALESLSAAVKKSDLVAAKAAYEAYDAGWNGTEVYTNVRNRNLYNQIEVELQKKVEEMLDEPQPKYEQIAPLVDQMLGKYDEIIALSQAGPALNPLFDDVAAIRLVRSHLRLVNPALKANNPAKAKAHFASFKDKWDDVEDKIKARSADAYKDIEDAMGKADQALKPDRPSTQDASPAVDALTARYNFGLALVNAAARGADGRPCCGPNDVQAAATLDGMQADLKASFTAWQAGKYDEAGQLAKRAIDERFPAVAEPLKAKSAGANLKTPLDAYAGLAGQQGDAGKVRDANRAAVEAAAVAQQTLAGQWWTDPAFQNALKQARGSG